MDNEKWMVCCLLLLFSVAYGKQEKKPETMEHYQYMAPTEYPVITKKVN